MVAVKPVEKKDHEETKWVVAESAMVAKVQVSL